MPDWASFFLMLCGILHVGTGIPLSDFYPFGANEKDIQLGQLMEAIRLF